ncbi:MAG: hypothetical protein AB7T63_15975 [Planctomycetota bacterium]
MTSWAVLVGRHLREARRAPGFGARVALGIAALALVAIATSGGMGGPARGLSGGLALFALLAAAQAASAAAVLPADRREGRRMWLGTLAPSAMAHRVSAAAAGVARIGLAALVAGGVLTVALALGPGLPRLDRDVGAPPRAPQLVRALRQGEPTPADIAFAPAALPRRLVLDLRPVLLSFEASPRAVQLDLRTGGAGEATRLTVPVRGVLALDVPPGIDVVQLASRSEDVHLRIRSARLLAPAGLPAAEVPLLFALAVGLAVASVVPWAVFAARFTSAPTAAGLTACLLLVGAVGRPLLALVADTRTADWARSVLEGVTALAPDLGLVAAARALLEGRVPDALLEGAGGSLLYLAVGFVLVALPGGETGSDA